MAGTGLEPMTDTRRPDASIGSVAPGLDVPSLGERVMGSLLASCQRLHPDRLASVVAEELAGLDMTDVCVYVVDLDQRLLIPLPGQDLPDRPALEINTTLAGRAFRTDQVIEGSADATGGDAASEMVDVRPAGNGDARRLWVPLMDGADRVGLLAVTVPSVDELTRQRARHLAAIVAELVVTKSTYGDGLLQARRLREMDLAAELRWALLPQLTYVDDHVAISGLLEPAYEIAGDSFDYAVNGDSAHFAILDAMGHGLEASRMASLGVVSYRHSRRQGLGLLDTFRAMDEVISSQFGDERFVTGQLASLTVSTGRLHWLNAGHPRPMLLRGGSHVMDLESETCLPMGLADVPTEVAEVSLEPGDCVLFFTDGVTEARSPDGELFGRDRLGDLLVRASASGEIPPEMMRRLCHAVLDHQSGRLQDDATLLVLCWSGPARES